MDTLTASPPRTRVGTRRSQASPPRVDRRVEWLVGLSSFAGAAVTTSAPTGTWLFDLAYRMVAIGLLMLAATRARRWTLLITSGVAAAVTASLLAQLAACVALALSVGNMRRGRRRQIVAASVAGLSAPALFLQGSDPLGRILGQSVSDPTGSSLVLGVMAVAPLLHSAWSRLHQRERFRVRRLLRRAGTFAIGAVVICVATSLFAFGPTASAIDATRRAGTAAAEGNLEPARPALVDAAVAWQRSHRRLNGPWLLPARAIPIVGQHVKIGQAAVRHAAELTALGSVVLAEVDTDAVIDDGRVNTELLGTLVPGTSRLASATADARDSLGDARAWMLLPPVGSLADAAIEQLEAGARATDAVAAGVDVGHELLGSATGSTIVVMFSTPAEARGAGGFVGNWAEFRAVDGRVELVEQYRSKQLNDALIATNAELRGDPAYVDRYGRFDVHRHVQDVTLSPDFPSVARVTSALYAQATGVRTDAIVMIDPFVLQALLAFTGPVEVDGMTLTGANAADELLRGQYERFTEDEEKRKALLNDLAAVVVERLLHDPPDPMPFVQEMAPLAQQGRIAVWFAQEAASDSAARMGLDASFPTGADDVIAVVHQNAAQNKIDPLLERSMHITTALEPMTGSVRHDVRIRLRNDSPSDGLPLSIIGSNDQGLPLGTNRMLLSVYSPFPLESARLDGDAISVETQREFDGLVHTFLLSLPARGDATLDFELAGTVDLRDGYDVDLPMQPLSRPDDVVWTLDAGGGLEPPDGWREHDGRLALDVPPEGSQHFRFSRD